ncbi:hypothetical protein ON010_g19179 [Phytophthora cinnamomi]|nr:hypothetical protein ON010_g19179 [Phytophthora cinnamomi]
MSLFEERLLAGGGIMPLYKKFGNRLFRVAVQDPAAEKGSCGSGGGCSSKEEAPASAVAGASKDLSW